MNLTPKSKNFAKFAAKIINKWTDEFLLKS